MTAPVQDARIPRRFRRRHGAAVLAMVASDGHSVRPGRIMHQLAGYLTAQTVIRGC